jgi:hypothetical protein
VVGECAGGGVVVEPQHLGAEVVEDAADVAFARRGAGAAACACGVNEGGDGAVTVAVGFDFTGGVVFYPVVVFVIPAEAAGSLAQDVEVRS